MASKKVSSKWSGGNLYFYDASGNEIFHIDGSTRAFVMHASAVMTAAGIISTGAAGGAAVQTQQSKAVSGLTDTTATDVFTVTVPNAQHTAAIEVDALGVMGAGGAVGAGETSKLAKYQVVITRTAGLTGVVTVSSAIGGVQSKVAGADNITSVVVTCSAMSGAASASQTFTIKVAITKAAGAADNHTLVATARVINQNASGVTIA